MSISQLTGHNYFAAHGYNNTGTRLRSAVPQTHDYLISPGHMSDVAPSRNRYPGSSREGVRDEFAISQFINNLGKYMGKALDANEVINRFDLDGDGLLSGNELTTMIKGLVSAEHEKNSYVDHASMSIVEQLLEMSGQNERPVNRVAGRYERLFQYEQINEPQELALFMA